MVHSAYAGGHTEPLASRMAAGLPRPDLTALPTPSLLNVSIQFVTSQTRGLNRSRLKAQFSPHRGAWRTRGRPQESETRVRGGPGAQRKSPATREPLTPFRKAGFNAASHGHGIQARCGRGSAWILRFGVRTLTSGRPSGASSRQRRGRRASPVQAPPGCSAPLSRGARSSPPPKTRL